MKIFIGPIEVFNIKQVVKHAELNPFSIDDLLDRMNHPELSPGINPNFQFEICGCIKMVFTIEHQQAGKVRHLSLSTNEKGKYPNMDATKFIMSVIGFTNQLEDCQVFVEKLEPGYETINILELV